MSIILGLESSCDDSAAALVTSDRRILAHAVRGQNEAHRPFGGVVPEIAARAHVEVLPGLIRDVLAEAQLTIAVLTPLRQPPVPASLVESWSPCLRAKASRSPQKSL
jgi:tRNA A37 threonylcarbamoyltransferase TsaD